MDDAYQKNSDECLNFFGVELETGLSPGQVEANRKKYGLNGEEISDSESSR